jgi:integrase
MVVDPQPPAAFITSATPPAPAPGNPLEPLVDAYLADFATVRAPATVRGARDDLRAIARAATDLGLPGDVRAWAEPDILALRDRFAGLAPCGVQRRVGVLGAFLAFHGNDVVQVARRQRRLPLPPARHGPVHVIDEATRRRLYAAARPVQRMALVLGFGLGLRLGELAAVRVDDIRDGGLVVRKGKGGKARTVPVGPDVEREVRAFVEGHRARVVARLSSEGDPGTLLVHLVKGAVRPYSPLSLGASLRGLGRRLGVRFSPHDMRRTFATELAERGAGLEAVREVLGHEDIETTRRYVHVRPERLRAGTEGYQNAICEEIARARG